MRRSLTAFTLFALVASTALAAATAVAEEIGPIEWTIGRSSEGAGLVQLSVGYIGSSGRRGWTRGAIRRDRLQGLSETADGEVRFRRVEDAGVLDCSGSFRGGRGSGECTFAASVDFARALERRGVGRPTVRQQFLLAIHDTGLELLDELERQRYVRPSVAELVRAGVNGANAEELAAFGAAGYHLRDIAGLLRLVTHSIDPEYLRRVVARHGRLTPDELIRMRNAEHVRDAAGEERKAPRPGQPSQPAARAQEAVEWEINPVRERGSVEFRMNYVRPDGTTGTTGATRPLTDFVGLTQRQLVSSDDEPARFRVSNDAGTFVCSGTTRKSVGRGKCSFAAAAGYAPALERLGIERPSDEQQMRLALHDVDIEYAAGFRAAGYALTIRDLFDLRIFRVPPRYARDLRDLGYDNLTANELIDLYRAGVTADYVRSLQRAGHTALTPRELMRMRERVRSVERDAQR